MASAKAKLNVQHFPRPPLLEKVSRHIRVTYNGHLIADTSDAFWVLETHHPPTYYLPRSAIMVDLKPTARRTWCEWKGPATYYSVDLPGAQQSVSNRMWSYERPSRRFEPIRGYVSMYAGPWQCEVDGEPVEPQPGDFYGGWVTSEVEGIVKGRNGNLDPVI